MSHTIANEKMGEEEAFLSYLSSFKGIVAKVARSYSRDAEEARDLTQEITMQLWRSFPKYKPEYSRATWTYRIALNVAISHLRKQQSRRGNEEAYLQYQEAHSVQDSDDERRNQLHAFIARLGELDRALIILYLEGCSNKEIAEVMGMSYSNVSTRKLRIVQQLRKEFSNIK